MAQFSALLPTPETAGDFEEMMLAAGRSAPISPALRPAGEVVRALLAEAEQVIR